MLNALEIDPGRPWKGVWRWFDESQLDCCRPLEVVRQQGVTLSEFGCLARCNGLRARVRRADLSSEEEFREAIKRTAGYLSHGSGKPAVLCASYHRGSLGQTGGGHFSPIGGYSPADDKVLILDVARFKYPCYWCDVSTLWKALWELDSISGKPRGFVVLSRATDPPAYEDELAAQPTSIANGLATPLTSLALSTMNFRHFLAELDVPPDHVMKDADSLVGWTLSRIKQVTSGMTDGGGSFSIVKRAAGLAKGNPVLDAFEPDSAACPVPSTAQDPAEKEWTALRDAIGLHPLYEMVKAHAGSDPEVELATLSVALLLPRLPSIQSSENSKVMWDKVAQHLPQSLEGTEMEPMRREMQRLGGQWDALWGECCGNRGGQC